MTRPGCMTEDEWKRWQERISDKDRIGPPCAYCITSWYVAQREAGACDSVPLHFNGRPRLPIDERTERRRAQWRAYRARKRAAA